MWRGRRANIHTPLHKVTTLHSWILTAFVQTDRLTVSGHFTEGNEPRITSLFPVRLVRHQISYLIQAYRRSNGVFMFNLEIYIETQMGLTQTMQGKQPTEAVQYIANIHWLVYLFKLRFRFHRNKHEHSFPFALVNN